MNGTLFFRTGLVLLLAGVTLGTYMGMTQNFTASPVHAHINLVGGVLMMIAGLFYERRPDIGPRARGLHYVLHLVGAVTLATGIYGAVTNAPWGAPVAGTGTIVTLLALLVFTANAFRRPR